MSNFLVTIDSISVYRRDDGLSLYIIVKQGVSIIKLFFGKARPIDLYKLTKHVGPVQVEVTINRNPTSTYKSIPVPFYDLVNYKLMANTCNQEVLDFDVADDDEMKC